MTTYEKKNSFIIIGSNWTINNIYCNIGEILSQKENLQSFNFKCFSKLRDCLLEKNLKNKHICRVEILGDIKKDRKVYYTNKIRIIEEINKEQIKNALLKNN